MILKNYLEKKQHGTLDFPIAVYRMNSTLAQNRAKPLYALHWHKELEFVTVRKGDAQVLVGNQSFYVKEGESVFINSNIIHAIFSSMESTEVEVFSIVFQSSLLESNYADVIYSKYIQPVLSKKMIVPTLLDAKEPWSLEVTQKLWQVISLFELYRNTSSSIAQPFYSEISYCKLNGNDGTVCMDGSEIRIKCLLLDIWLNCFEHAKAQQEKSSGIFGYYSDCVKEAISYINIHYDADISLKQLADLTHMSRESFSRIFKKCTGFPLFSYINQVRIYHSLEYLCAEEKKMTEIAGLCGYQNVSYFNRKFHELMNCSPTEYRQKVTDTKQV